MRIVTITDCLEGGGAEKFCRLAHKQFMKDNHNSTLICIRKSLKEKEQKEQSIIFLNKSSLRRAAIPLIRTIFKKRPEIIITSIFQASLLISILKQLGLFKDTKFILRHSSNIFERLEIFRFEAVRYLYATLINNAADIIISQSEHLKDKLILGGISDINHIVIPNMIEGDTSFSRSPDDFCVFVGRLESIKNLFELTKCFNKINKFPKLLIIGEGAERDRLQIFINENELNVEIQGWSDNVRTKIHAAKFLILTSLSEGLPNVVLESLQVNTPVISTDNSQLVRDLHNKRWCKIIEGFDHRAITHSIQRFIEQDDFTVFSTEHEQREFMMQFTADVICERLMETVS